MELPFIYTPSKIAKSPLILSIPHCGTKFPSELVNNYLPEQIKSLDDTDWFLQDLYNFANELGIDVVQAKYSRWLIDLNRDPESAPLYDDGRIITGLTTQSDFLGNPIYKEGCEPDIAEVEQRLQKYYWPYYNKIQELLNERVLEFGNAILWDAHSIREFVPTIREQKFPEMILGTADEKSADISLINTALTELRKGYQVNHNDPFKGGHITRYFGNPSKNIHALQLERNKILYMDDAELAFDEPRADKMRTILKETLTQLIDKVKKL